MANIVEQTPNTADKAISLLDNVQIGGTAPKKIDYSSVRGKVIYSLSKLYTLGTIWINTYHIIIIDVPTRLVCILLFGHQPGYCFK